MAMSIVKIIKEKYSSFVNNECMDLTQIINICIMYKNKNKATTTEIFHEPALEDVHFSSPIFEKINPKNTKKKKHDEILNSEEFRKKYDFFIKIIFTCLKMNIDIFDITGDFATLNNNYKLAKTMEHNKKKIIEEHYLLLKEQHKHVNQKLDIIYEKYVFSYILKIKIIDKMIESINILVKNNVFDRTDNLFSLIIPYFYNHRNIIEEYN